VDEAPLRPPHEILLEMEELDKKGEGILGRIKEII